MDAWRDQDPFVVEFDLPGIDAGLDRPRRRTQRPHRSRRPAGPRRHRRTRRRRTAARRLQPPTHPRRQPGHRRYHRQLPCGVLRLEIPVAEKAKPRKISIKSGDDQSHQRRPRPQDHQRLTGPPPRPRGGDTHDSGGPDQPPRPLTRSSTTSSAGSRQPGSPTSSPPSSPPTGRRAPRAPAVRRIRRTAESPHPRAATPLRPRGRLHRPPSPSQGVGPATSATPSRSPANLTHPVTPPTWTGWAGAAKLIRPDGRRRTTPSGLARPSYPPAPARPIARRDGGRLPQQFMWDHRVWRIDRLPRWC